METHGRISSHSTDRSLSLFYNSYSRRQQKRYGQEQATSFQQSSFEESALIDNEEVALIEKETPWLLDSGSDIGAEASTARKAVVMLACLYMLACAYGMSAALGVIYAELIPRFNSPRSQAALVQTVYAGVTLGGGVFMTVPIRKYGPGKCVMLASLVASLALMLSFFATDIQTLIMTVGGITGFAMSTLNLAGHTAVSLIFANRRKMALGVLTFGTTLGQVPMPFIVNELLNRYDWNGTFLILSALMPLNCVPCGIILLSSSQYFGAKTKDTMSIKQHTKNCLMAVDAAFFVFILSLFLRYLFAPIENWFVVDLAVMKGFSRELGGSLLSINGIFGFIGRTFAVLILRLRPNTAPDLHLAYGFVLFGLGHYLVISSAQYWSMVLAMVVRSMSIALIVGMTPSLLLDLRGVELYIDTTALCNLIDGSMQIVGGYVGGLSVDITGNYSLIFYIATAAAGICAVCMVVVYLLRKRRQE